jgi:hypothetical protein
MALIVEAVGENAEELSERLAAYERDVRALTARWDELLAAHPNEWVAMHDGKLFHAADLETLFEVLRRDGIEPGRAAREFLGRDLPPLLL